MSAGISFLIILPKIVSWVVIYYLLLLLVRELLMIGRTDEQWKIYQPLTLCLNDCQQKTATQQLITLNGRRKELKPTALASCKTALALPIFEVSLRLQSVT